MTDREKVRVLNSFLLLLDRGEFDDWLTMWGRPGPEPDYRIWHDGAWHDRWASGRGDIDCTNGSEPWGRPAS